VASIKNEKWEWWEKRRWRYNKGLIIAGMLAFLLYYIVGEILIAPHEEFEVTLFTIAFQGIAYLIMMGIANGFYVLGYVIDRLFNKKCDEIFQNRLYSLGYWFSFCLPFTIPLLVTYIFLNKY
jgi:hypothetical protein